MNKFIYYVYILKSLVDGTLYAGLTTDLRNRFIEHELKKSKYTSKKEDLILIFYSTFIGQDARQKATQFEKYLKSGYGRAFVKRHILVEN